MNVIEKAEKALEHLRNIEGSSKNHVIQAAAATLGRRLGALGSRQNFSRHYANLLHSALPTLLSLASNESAEMRLVGDEALNRIIVGGFAFHSYKTNVLLQNQIDPSKNARWIRAALSRICLGDTWLRPGVGKIRSQAQTLFPKLSQIVRQTTEVQLIVETLDSNLPRILKGLAEYTTDEEISDFSKALMTHIESNEPAVRRGISNCIGHLCSYREPLLTNVLEIVFGKLWPLTSDSNAILGWFSVIKSIFQINNVHKFADSDLFTIQDYLELYTLCLHYIQQSTTEHNVQNTVLECLTVLLNNAKGKYRKALLEKHPKIIVLDARQMDKGHRRNISSTSIIPAQPSNLPTELRDPEIQLSGALHLGSLLQLSTPSLSVDDLSMHTPDSPVSDSEMHITDSEQLTKDLSEKLQEIEDSVSRDEDVADSSPLPLFETTYKINIGSMTDDDVLLKYCARLLASKFILTGDKGGLIHDRSIRVSVKASALNCLSEVLKLYPQAITMYLDKDAEAKSHNVSGSTETDSNQDNINDFILERNVCYQDSLTDSLCQELFNRSLDSQQASLMSKKDGKSIDVEKSMESTEQKSSLKDIHSNILDSKALKNELIASAMSADNTNANMTISNFTTNSNMTGSSDRASTGYPMSTSGDILSSSIDLDIKFDHFGESNTNLYNQKDYERPKKILQRAEELHSKDVPDSKGRNDDCSERNVHEFEFQHMSEIFSMLEGHNDPQIKGLVRLCIGNYLCASLDLSHGDYHRWKIVSHLPKDLYDCLSIENLMNIVLKGLTDEIHSAVNHTLSALINLSLSLCQSTQWSFLNHILNSLVDVEGNKYWLCRVNLCKLYEKFPYQRLFTLYSDFRLRSKSIMETLIRLLADQDHKVRSAAIQALVSVMPYLRPSLKATPTSTTTEMTYNYSTLFNFSHNSPALSVVRNMYFYSDLPEQMKFGNGVEPCLKTMVGDLFWRLMSSSCRNFTQGLLETLLAITHKWLPWQHADAYTEQGILSFCLESVNVTSSPVVFKTVLLDLCCRLYPIEIHSIMRHKSSNYDIFERDSQEPSQKWQHLDNEKTANLSEKFLQITLKMLNMLVHLIEEVNPNIHLNKSGIALPGSPVRKKSQESVQKKPEPVTGTLRKKPTIMSSLKGNLTGHFYNEPVYMKLYENLRAAYSNHKINLDPKSSIFYDFLSTTLHSLAVQLELSTEKEFGPVTEELLFYLKAIMPLRADLTVYCITQLLKCLFGTNMINQYTDFLSITDKVAENHELSFFQDVMLMNSLEKLECRRDSVSSNSSQYFIKDPKMAAEKQLLIAMENFSKNKIDKKWNTNKRELERYIRLFEPVVIQALKSYTMQSDIPLQCKVLALLNQLLALRVNYCLLDSDQIFIAFLMKQLQFVELQEIPDCCDLVNSLLTFLVQLSTSKHHSEQIIEIPKLIQVCDGLMASGGHMEFIAGIEPVAIKVFSNMSGANVLGRTQQQEAQTTKEVLFYMLQKSMHQPKVLDLVSCVLCLSRDQSENYSYWCGQASHTLLNLLLQSSIEIDTFDSIKSLERLIDCLFKDVLLEQNRVEVLLKILFKAPPDQATTPYKLKVRYLSIIMVLLRKILVLVPESEILLSINSLKATHIAPSSIFFNVKPDIDPLNVLNVNENCANLSPDVILVRFLFKTLTYAILELDNCNEIECGNLDLKSDDIKGENHRLLYAVCVNIIVQVKHMLHLTDDCHFPLTSKTAQSLLQNEQSGLNTGLYSPEENIPLELMNLICIRCAHRMPLLTIHWSHLLIRLNFISNKCWQRLTGFVGRTPLSDNNRQSAEILHIACVMAYCEYFTQHGLSEVVQLTWLLVNRVHILLTYYASTQIVKQLIHKVQENVTASGLLLQAVAARCQHCLKDEFALNTYKVLSICHESQSGPLVFLICRIIGKLEPAISVRFAKLAIQRCRLLKDMEPEQITMQLSKEDVQVALEMLQREKVYVRYPSLVVELNSLASSVFDLSPLDLSQERAINPQYIATTNVDAQWLVNLVKNRCSQSECALPKVPKYYDLARLLSNLTKDNLTTVMSCSEFDRRILSTSFKVSCDNFLKEFLNMEAIFESKEITRESMRDCFSNLKVERKASVDSNKLSNTIHVFKKSDNKESKSQFFIPITDTDSMKDKFGNLQLTEDELEFAMPDLPELYKASLLTFDSALTEIIRLFPKQNRPLSQSENFDLNIEQTIDRYTRRCHQVFQDKLFYQEFVTVQSVLNGFLESVDKILTHIDEFDCELVDKCIENILPISTAKNIAIFCVISLQYLSFLVKNKKIVESPVQADVSFRATATVTDDIVVDNVILLTVENVSKAFGVREIWTELNTDSNLNRIQSAISCLYAVVKYLVKDTKPLTLKRYIPQDSGPKSDVVLVGDKLITLVEYWETNMYGDRVMKVLDSCYKVPLEQLIVHLARLEMINNIALIPPLAWTSVDITKKDLLKIDLPLHAFQDMDVLEAFLFRVNLIGWSSKKQFEEIWVGLLGALQGNGTHWAVRGITALLVSAAPMTRKGVLHVPRTRIPVTNGHQLLRNIVIGTSAYKLFQDVNLERIPMMNDGNFGYHYAQFNSEYLKMAGDTTDERGTAKTRRELKRVQRTDIDVNSCLQLLMDIASDMLEPKASTGLAARLALISCIAHASGIFSTTGHWVWACTQLSTVDSVSGPLLYGAAVCLPTLKDHVHLHELSTVHQRLLKSLTSSIAALRQAALHGCLLQLHEGNAGDLTLHLHAGVTHNIRNVRISLYEQSLYWAVLFTLVELGHPELMNLAVDFLLTNPYHYCTDLVVKGITSVLRQQVLPKDLKNIVIEKLLDNMRNYSEHHAMQILMVHLFSADTKLLSPKLTNDVSNMDPDILMNSMERMTLLYKVLRQCKSKESKYILSNTLKYFLRETLPPAATLSRVVIEFVESCKETERLSMSLMADRERAVLCSVLNSEIVFEVFETSVTQDQLPVLSGWIFEALCHLLNGKLSPELLPFCVLTLLVCASSNPHIRLIAPLIFNVLKYGFYNNVAIDQNWGVFKDILKSNKSICFKDKCLLCIVALKSSFSRSQHERLKELCLSNDCLKDLLNCLCSDFE